MAKKYRIAVLPGDGVGPEVVREGRKVLDAAADAHGFGIGWREYPYSGAHYLKTKELLPDEALVEMRRCDAIYMGAIGHPRLKPGIVEQGILLKLRFALDLYVNLRPIKLYEGVDCPIAGKTKKDVQFYVVRENTEDFYIGAGGVLHPDTPQEQAFQIGVITRRGAERIMKYAFEFAKRKGLKRITCCDKANVLTHVYGLWRKAFAETAARYPGIETEYAFVDAITQWFVRKPENYRLVVAPNMFGDIITDLGAAIQGGMGLAPGANVNPDGVSMFEPIHGSAPKHAGKNVINPIACILAGAMMLENVGEAKAAAAVENAVERVLAGRKVRTYDLGGSAKTSEVGDAIVAALA
jgi:3-isopropylmalate dehydrogenase